MWFNGVKKWVEVEKWVKSVRVGDKLRYIMLYSRRSFDLIAELISHTVRGLSSRCGE